MSLFARTSSLLRSAQCPARFLSTTQPWSGKALPPRPKPPPETEIHEKLLKGSGPGGQKINKTTSAVQLKHLPTGIVVKSQATRSLNENRKIARKLLAERLDELNNGELSRESIVGKIKKKKRDSADKKSKRKYRLLEEEKDIKADDKAQQSSDDPHVTEVQDHKHLGNTGDIAPDGENK